MTEVDERCHRFGEGADCCYYEFPWYAVEVVRSHRAVLELIITVSFCCANVQDYFGKKRHRPWQVTIRRFGHEEGNEDGSNKYIFGYCKWCWVFGYDMVLTDFLLLRFKPFALLPVTYVKSCSTDTSDLIVLTLPFHCIREISIILMHATKSTHIIFVCRTTTVKAPTLPMHLTSSSFPNLQDTWPAQQ
ncbi:unnamed protein product [Vicia faba]|uniref:Uncharacterized protein n=1 Tax=Vicia faba TaxID=3906 RepID=A0AAV0ZT57_VICFA|nr:unnamed protein product [Vicia faba]